MLTMRPPQLPDFSDATLLTPRGGVQSFRKKDRLLLVEPESASWIVIEERDMASWQKLRRSLTVREFLKSADNGRNGDARDLLYRLYTSGTVQANGRWYFSSAAIREPDTVHPTIFSLRLVEGCNFRCAFCYDESPERIRIMPLKTGRKILERIFYELPGPDLIIIFLGGEPFLAFDEMVHLAGYASDLSRKCSKRVRFVVRTNGSLLTRSRILLLKELGFNVILALEGPEHLHDRFRRSCEGLGTFATVLSNLQLCRQEGLAVMPAAMIRQPGDCMEALRFFLGLGLSSFTLNLPTSACRSAEGNGFEPERIAQEYLKMVDEAFSFCRERKAPLRIANLHMMLKNIISRKREHMCLRSPCGMGRSVLSFGLHGEIYACEEHEPSICSRLLLGNIEDPDEIPDLLAGSPVCQELSSRIVSQIPKCRRCIWRNFCGAGCTRRALASFGELLREDPLCRFYQVVYENLIWRIAEEPLLPRFLGGG